MKRFLVPAIFVVDVENTETYEQALNRAAALANVGNEYAFQVHSSACCILDDKLPTKEIQIDNTNLDLPSTYLTDGAPCGVEP